MKLDINELKDITFGVDRIEKINNEITFNRFTLNEENYYKENNINYLYKVYASSNIKLDFITDSTYIKIKLSFNKGSSRNFSFIDIYKDDVLFKHLGSLDSNTFILDEKIDIGDNLKKITIYFPWSSSTKLLNFEIDDNSIIEPVKKDSLILFYGDSITQGYDSLYPSLSYANRVASYFNLNSINKAIGGEVFNKDLIDSSFKYDAKYIVVAFGTNDFEKDKSLEEFKKRSYEFYKKLSDLYNDSLILALTPIYRCDYNVIKDNNISFKDIENTIIENTKDIKNIRVIKCFDFIPENKSYFMDEYLHPNDNGFSHYSKALINELKKYIK